MTPTKAALKLLNDQRLSQSQRNAIIELASRLAKDRACLDVVPAWFVRDAMQQLGIESEVRQ